MKKFYKEKFEFIKAFDMFFKKNCQFYFDIKYFLPVFRIILTSQKSDFIEVTIYCSNVKGFQMHGNCMKFETSMLWKVKKEFRKEKRN